jgi:hypothetical protein
VDRIEAAVTGGELMGRWGGGVSQSRCRGVWGRSVGGASGVGRPVGLLGWTVGFRRWTIGQSL